jgi:CelD/BcsL family acetyltransferase involved in cellulose biosynthesis
MQTKGTSYRSGVPHNQPAKRHITHALLSCTLAGLPGDCGCSRKEKENKEKEKRKRKHKERRKIEEMNHLFFRNYDVQFI